MPVFIKGIARLFFIAAFCIAGTKAFCQQKANEPIRRSPVSYHMSFDNKDFFNEDFIEQSGKKTLQERKIDFPGGKFGKGIRMSFIPAPADESNMSGIDLDLNTAVIFNTRPGNTMGYNEPFIWGSGRISPRLGAVAFWAKGKLPFAGPLFEQTTISFGRKERDLIGILTDKENKLSAYVRDARYVVHEVKSNIVWDESAWNHVVLNWDWANGMELWLNGRKIASSWGTDGWFETAPPGLFHLPAPGLVYDELYLMDRPLSEPEIKKLMSSNIAPKEEAAIYARKNYDAKRLAQYSGADRSEKLPVASPGKSLSFSEVWPTAAADGKIPGWHIIDGRNEMAWPHEYAFFTIIPGDADYHAQKVDIQTAPKSIVNYVTLTGNLTNVKVQAGSGDMKDKEDVFSVPSGNGFFYGSTINATEGSIFRIPFTESYGTPAGFKGDVYLPLSGEKRIQELGLYHVVTTSAPAYQPQGDKLLLSLTEPLLDKRTQFALHALTSRDERKIAMASQATTGGPKAVDIGGFGRLNIISEPYLQPVGITAVTVSLPIKTSKPEEVLFIKVRDPGVPSRIWNQFAFKLSGFDKNYNRLLLTIDFRDIVVTGGDRLWLDIGTADKTEVLIGDKTNEAALFVSSVSSYQAINDYAEKEIMPGKAQYSKNYEYMPWQFTGSKVSLDDPYCYGGSFDMLLPALALHRVKPDDFVADYLIKICGPDYKDGKRKEQEKTPLITLTDSFGAPDWAVYMRDFNKKRWAMSAWWADHQNPDGQVGGGWDDDVLFMSAGQSDLPLDGDDKARNLIDAIHTGFEKTSYFKSGYCNIYPIDRLHSSQFIKERFNTVVNNLGQPHAAEREMESAWHLDKPDKTPANYLADGYKSSVNVFNWYWGKDVPDSPYISKPLKELGARFRLYASVFDDYSFYRMTGSNVHRDDFVPFGSNEMYTYILGGERGSLHGLDVHVRLAVTWPSGGGPDVSRVVLHADNHSLDAALYSFDSQERNLKMRLCRINDGMYKIGLYEDAGNTGTPGAPVWTTEMNLSRFDVVTLPVPARKSLILKVEQLTKIDRPAELADLAIDANELVNKNGTVTATIHNLGNARADNIVVRLLDGEKIIQEKLITQLDAPIDFVAKHKEIVFTNVTGSRNLKLVIDPENKIREILKENNSAKVMNIRPANTTEIAGNK